MVPQSLVSCPFSGSGPMSFLGVPHSLVIGPLLSPVPGPAEEGGYPRQDKMRGGWGVVRQLEIRLLRSLGRTLLLSV